MPISSGCSQAIWQTKIAHAVQGRVFAIRRALAYSAMPLAYAASGPWLSESLSPRWPRAAMGSRRLDGCGRPRAWNRADVRPGWGSIWAILVIPLFTCASGGSNWRYRMHKLTSLVSLSPEDVRGNRRVKGPILWPVDRSGLHVCG